VIIADFFDPICGDDHPYITRYERRVAPWRSSSVVRRSG
jgi:hypothetical protein